MALIVSIILQFVALLSAGVLVDFIDSRNKPLARFTLVMSFIFSAAALITARYL